MLADTDAASLARCALFRALPLGTVADLLARGARCRTVEPRELLFAAGATGEALFVLLPQNQRDSPQSLVMLLAPVAQVPIAVEIVTAGDVFGEIEPLRRLDDNQPQARVLEARALTRVRVAEIPWPLLRELLRRYPQAQVQLAARLATRTGTLVTALRIAATESVDTRLARLLLSVLPLCARQRSGRNANQGLSQSDLANALGIRRETVSLQLARWRRAGLIDLASGRTLTVPDPARLRRLVSAATGSASVRADDTVRAALAAGHAFRARNLALDIFSHIKGALALQHLAVLACARAGATTEADRLLRLFGFAHGGNVDQLARRLAVTHSESETDLPLSPIPGASLLEDIAALEPRLAKDADLMQPPGEARAAACRVAAEAYARVFARTGGAYSGINAASLFAFAGDMGHAAQAGRTVLERLPRQMTAYYDFATRAEAELLIGQPEAAAATLRDAAVAADATRGSISTTRRQLRQLASSLGMDWPTLDAALPQRAVLVFVGASLGLGGAVSGSALQPLAAAAWECIASQRAGVGYGSLAAGGELLVADALLEVGADLNVVLPGSVDAFTAAAVRPAPAWLPPFEKSLAAPASVTVAGGMQQRALDHAAFNRAARRAMGLALLEAELIEAPCRALRLDGGGASAAAFEAWQALGLPITDLSLPWPSSLPVPAERASGDDNWRAAVFAWLPAPASLAAALRIIDAIGPHHNVLATTTYGGHRRRAAAVFITKSVNEAQIIAEFLVR